MTVLGRITSFLLALVVAFTLTFAVQTPALAHKTCRNNHHYHASTDTSWWVYDYVQVGPNQIKKKWKRKFEYPPYTVWKVGYIIC
jgi:hypothetical protein